MVELGPRVGTEPVRLESEESKAGSRDDLHAWGMHRWHQQDVRRFPADFDVYDDVPRLFREFILPGHVPAEPLLTPADKVVTLGSCFAEELREVLQKADFRSGLFWYPSGLNNTFALLDFVSWAATGSVTHRAFRYERSAQGEIVEWTPGRDQASYAQEFRDAGAFVFTLGLAEVWLDRATDQVFWRGVPENIYDENRHEFRLTSVGDNESNIREIIRLIQTVNPRAPIVLTLSPVPLLATFRDVSCMTADCVSKSVLRVALDNVMSEKLQGVYYWPSFELVKWAGAALDWRAYGQDARHAQRYLVQCIMSAFVESYYGYETAAGLRARLRRGGHEVGPPHTVRRSVAKVRRFRRRIHWKIAHEIRRATA
jgi:GSCFA family protein